jgi:hypothetical protein
MQKNEKKHKVAMLELGEKLYDLASYGQTQRSAGCMRA